MTGGAGHIGSRAAHAPLDLGHDVVILDDLSTRFRSLPPPAVTLIEGRVQDQALVEAVLRDHDIAAVLHFTGSIEVGGSVEYPLKYYANNTD